MQRVWVAAFLLFSIAALGQDESVIGNWRNPTGSTIEVYRCGGKICARVIGIRADAPGRVDANNPNPALRKRPLCGLQIGTNFYVTSPGRADGGQLYDPQSGRTYSGSMTRDGDKLKLRGYIGLALFGRTETWTRAPKDFVSCHP
jgi:uncharacterized protein (DUF2147 family)